MKSILQKIDSGIYYLENSVILVALGSMVILSFLQVVLRNLFDTGILWGDILLRHLVLWVGFVGASLATREEKHINIDILTKLLSPRMVPYIRIMTNLFAVWICFILAKASYVFTFQINSGTKLFLDIPAWYIQIILPVGFALIGFRFLLKILMQIFFGYAEKNVEEGN